MFEVYSGERVKCAVRTITKSDGLKEISIFEPTSCSVVLFGGVIVTRMHVLVCWCCCCEFAQHLRLYV